MLGCGVQNAPPLQIGPGSSELEAYNGKNLTIGIGVQLRILSEDNIARLVSPQRKKKASEPREQHEVL